MRAVYHINMAWQSQKWIFASAPPEMTRVRGSNENSPCTYLATVMPAIVPAKEKSTGIHIAYAPCGVTLTYLDAYLTIAVIQR